MNQTIVRHELSDQQIRRFFKSFDIDTRKTPPTREQLFGLVRAVFKSGSEIDVMHIKHREPHAIHKTEGQV